jgi:hypothetical protein
MVGFGSPDADTGVCSVGEILCRRFTGVLLGCVEPIRGSAPMPASTTPKINLLTILTFITSISGKIPQLLQLVNAIIALFAGEIEKVAPAGGLEVAELSADESAKAEQITQAISTEGTEAFLDLSGLRRLVTWLNTVKDSPLGKLLIGLFAGGLGG